MTVPPPICPRHNNTPYTKKTGVLLVNLGTPDAYTYGPMRRYLSEFLMDKRVVDITRWLWCPLLHFIILSTRPQKAGQAYASIWNKDLDESPLRTTTRAQAEGVARMLDNDAVVVDWAMRYGNPSIKSVMKKLEGCTRIIVVPLYPQYAGATVGSVMDAVGKAMPSLKFTPALQTVAPYYDDPDYIKLLAKSVREHYAKRDLPDVLLTSFHGVPVRYCTEGDPYFCHCHKTARLLAEELGWDFIPDWREDFPPSSNGKPRLCLTFQSVFGKEVWLQPYTDKSLEHFAEEGIKNIGVITPGFAADCVETLEEINIEGRAEFEENGGETFEFIPCLNAQPAHTSFLSNLIKKFL